MRPALLALLLAVPALPAGLPAATAGCTPCECGAALCEGGHTWWPEVRALRATPRVEPGANATVSFRVELVTLEGTTYPADGAGWSTAVAVAVANRSWGQEDWSSGRVPMLAVLEPGNDGHTYTYPHVPGWFNVTLPAVAGGTLHARVKGGLSGDWSAEVVTVIAAPPAAGTPALGVGMLAGLAAAVALRRRTRGAS